MKTLRCFTCATLLLAIVAPTTAGARIVKIETTAALSDHSDQAIDGAFENALDTCVRGAVAMGLTSIWLDRAVVMTDKVVVNMTASDEDKDRREVKTMELMPSVLSF